MKLYLLVAYICVAYTCTTLTQVHCANVEARGVCTNIQFRCGAGNCLDRENDINGVCDGRSDCGDGSDERRCGLGTCSTRQYQCDNQRCISGGLVCDNNDDCGDNSDEIQCGSSNFIAIIIGVVVGALVVTIIVPIFVVVTVLICIFCVYRKHQRRRPTTGSGVPMSTYTKPVEPPSDDFNKEPVDDF